MKTLLIQLMTITGMLLIDLALDYQTVGYGLTPDIAYPVATGLLGLPLVITFSAWYYDRYYGIETITLHTGNCSRCGRRTDLVNGRCSNGCARP